MAGDAEAAVNATATLFTSVTNTASTIYSTLTQIKVNMIRVGELTWKLRLIRNDLVDFEKKIKRYQLHLDNENESELRNDLVAIKDALERLSHCVNTLNGNRKNSVKRFFKANRNAAVLEKATEWLNGVDHFASRVKEKVNVIVTSIQQREAFSVNNTCPDIPEPVKIVKS